jgi:hypothetical protein
MTKSDGGVELSLLKIFAILSLIGLVIFWFFTLLAIPMSANQYAVITGQYPLFLWVVFVSFFTGASAILSLAIIIQLTGRIDALEILRSQSVAPSSEPETE